MDFTIKYFRRASARSRSLITPSLRGLAAIIVGGVLPSIFLASPPIAKMCLVFLCAATTVGSLIIIPLPTT